MVGPHSSKTAVDFCGRMHAQLPTPRSNNCTTWECKAETHIHDERIAQLQQHSSSTAATERLDGRGVASDQTKVKVDRSDASLKKDCKMHLAHHLKRQL